MHAVRGIHHITAIAGPAQENLDFYAGILGMRLVKRSINQDDPGTYHLFYADAEGHPGTDLTFFPWAQMAPPRIGHGLAVEVGARGAGRTASPGGRRGSSATASRSSPIERRFGDTVLPLVDVHGMRVALTESARASRAPVHALGRQSDSRRAADPRPLRRADLGARREAETAAFLTSALGFRVLGRENGWTRYGFDAAPGVVDIRRRRTSGAARGASAPSTISRGRWRI